MAAPAGSIWKEGAAWRQFQFFDSSPIRDVNDFGGAPKVFRTPNSIFAVASHPSSSTLLLADIDGNVHRINKDYEIESSWRAYEDGRVTHMTIGRRRVLVTLGEEEASRYPILKIWDLRRKDESGAPLLLRMSQIQRSNRPHPITTLALAPSLSHLAIGLADGSVLVLRHLDQALAASTSPTTPLPKFKVVHEGGEGEPITGLGFREPLDGKGKTGGGRKGDAGGGGVGGSDKSRGAQGTPAASGCTLLIVTTSRVLSYIVTGKGSGSAAKVVDEVGCGLGCATMAPPAAMLSPDLPSGKDVGAQKVTSPHDTGAPRMVAARSEAIYVYGAEGREACYAYEGPKSSVALAAPAHLVIVSPPFLPSAASASATVRNYVSGRAPAANASTSSLSGSPTKAGAGSPTKFGSPTKGSPMNSGSAFAGRGGSRGSNDISKVTLFDLDNKLIAYSGTFEKGVKEVWSEGRGELVVWTNDGGLTRLTEKPISQKLELLYRKNLFQLAVSLARSHGADAPAMAEVYRKYGDHLYLKGDYEGAVDKFERTITKGGTEPSYVIRKFLDAQRIHNLTSYLQALHAHGMANSDHTTLLLNCFTKLKDVQSLDRFIKTPRAVSPSPSTASAAVADGHGVRRKQGGQASAEGADETAATEEEEELPFDLETAMRVCRQSGYYSHASYLARRYGEHDEYVRIQVEDVGDWADALGYVKSMDAEVAERILLKHGKAILSHLPVETTDVLIDLCSGNFSPVPWPSPEEREAAAAAAAKKREAARLPSAGYLSYLQVGSYGKATTASKAEPSKPQLSGGDGAGGEKMEVSSSSGTGKERSQPPVQSTSKGESSPTMMSGGGSTETNGRGDGVGDSAAVEAKPAYRIPSPRIFFAHFVHHPHQLMGFLEEIARRRWGQAVAQESLPTRPPMRKASTEIADGLDEEMEKLQLELGGGQFEEDYDDAEKGDQRSVWNTLLELYLSLSRPSPPSPSSSTTTWPHPPAPERRRALRSKAFRLLTQHETLPYNVHHALLLCSMEGFVDGTVYLYERLGMYEDVVRLWMEWGGEQGDGGDDVGVVVTDEEGGGAPRESAPGHPGSARVMAALRVYGPTNPHLYGTVLSYLVSSPSLLSTHSTDMADILATIEREGIMSPLEVVQTLARSGYASVGLVRDYLRREIEGEQREIEGDRHLIDSYRTETAKKLREVAELSDPNTPRVFQVTKCSACGGQLDLPSVHFMCRHSYHRRCLADSETECPNCARAHGVIREIRRTNEALADQHDLFLQEVAESEDGFETVANAFSKGLMARPGAFGVDA